ncbi:MAG: hypothetical protein COA99_03100 [Moraxellaceae bacterium]|nr:MAG: hypothetical protein COA99_03100 [Moraxellaceae bacterium]
MASDNSISEPLSSESILQIESFVEDAFNAHQSAMSFSDAQLDEVICAISEKINKNILWFAQEEVKETGLGFTPHKVHKLGLVTQDVTQSLCGIKTTGLISTAGHGTVMEYGSPVGVIFAVIPMTNPIPNSLFKILHSIKTRNAIILSYPSKTRILGRYFLTLVQELLAYYSLPIELVQMVPEKASRIFVQHMMSHSSIDLVMATGGSGIVKAAHQSGNPTYGVGPGNAPVIICESADIKKAIYNIVQSKTYDHGIVCGSENNLICAPEIYDEAIENLEHNCVAVLSSREKEHAIGILFSDEGQLRRILFGQSANKIAVLCDIKRDYQIKMIVIPAESKEVHRLGREKMAPIVSLFKAPFQEAIILAKTILTQEGIGHTAAIHSRKFVEINDFAEKIPAGRLLVNTPSTFGMMGVSTDLPISFALGSGTWGNNITTDGITWRHFINIKYLAKHTSDIHFNDE